MQPYEPVSKLIVMAEQTTGMAMRKARLEAEEVRNRNKAIRLRCDEEDLLAMKVMAQILEPHQGIVRLVTGEPIRFKGIMFDAEPMLIEKAGLSDKTELQMLGLIAVVRASQITDEDTPFSRPRPYYFDPFDSRFMIEPVELAD